MIHPKLANWIVGMVAVVWAANFVATAVPQLHYKPDPAVHGVFMMVVGGALVFKKKDGNGNDKDGDESGSGQKVGSDGLL